MTNKYKAVVFTGGGYFGVTIASFLSFLGKDYDLPNHVDCLAGTSIGGIIACAFMGGCSTQNLLDGFVQNGEKIFTKRWQNKINPLSLPFYGNEALKEVIESFVGEQTIGDAKKRFPCTAMFVPATNMTKNKLKVFDTVDPRDEHYKLSEVSLYTSAAEFYFPVLEDEGDAITDGGIRECCPVVTTACAIKDKVGVDFKDIDMFVFGVGRAIDGIDAGCGTYKEVSRWGALDWVRKFVVPDVTNSNISMSKFWGEHLGFNSFTFFNPIQIYGGMDDVSVTDHILTESIMYKEKFLEEWEKFLER